MATITGGSGDDSLDGGADNDVVSGEGGNDTLHGGAGDDSVVGGDGNDSVIGDEGNDTLEGGAGADSLFGQEGNDTLHGGEGNDSLRGGIGDDSLAGDGGDDTLVGGTGHDTLDGGTGNDSLYGQEGNDSLEGGDGHDYLGGGDGSDTLSGGAGNDTISAGADNDTITGGAGDDIITTGSGDDLVILQQFGGNDTITDFDIGDTDLNGLSNDQLDVSDLRDLAGNPVNIWDVVVTDDGFGNALLTFPEGETLTLQGITPAQMSAEQMVASGIPCYAPGTLIDTPDGPRAVEKLAAGDLVNTLDQGPQTIRWFRNGDHPLEAVDVDAKPVLIAAGALGKGRPTQDLIVSPQHRMLVGGGGQLDGWFKTEAFAPAKSLTSLPGIRHMKGKESITWIHFACDRHEVVTANGCLSESLLLGPMVVNGLPSGERRDLATLYGAAPTPDAALNGPAARECLKVSEVRRHLAKCKKAGLRRTAKAIKNWDIDLATEQWEADRFGVTMANGQKSDLRIAC